MNRIGWACCQLGMLIALESGFAQNFRWRTQAAGLESVARTNGVALADYDRDGDLDVYFVVQDSYEPNDPRTWNRLFSNQGDGTFLNVTIKAGLAGKNSNTAFSYMGYKMGAAWGDYDNDGWPDIFLTHFGSDQLFHNNGDGTFTEVTAQAGVGGGKSQLSTSALWFDYDLDGDLDLYVSNWEDYVQTARDTKNWLYENVGGGKFLDVSDASGLADKGKTWTTVAFDANNDGKLDIYVANDFGPSHLYLNNGDKTFQEKTAEFGLKNDFHGMGLAIGDGDGNGYFDLYLTNITEMGNEQELNPLFFNTGQNYFINKSVEAGVALAGWGWGTEFFDLENDGDEDLFAVNGYFLQDLSNDRLFRNISDSSACRFEEISHTVGINDTTDARGLAIFDYDNDGDLDILISDFAQTPSLYENSMVHGNWLKVKLEGTLSNRDAFGTIVEVRANGKSYKKYHHGAQFLAQNIMPLHFGLNEAQRIEQIIVNWPSGYVDEIGAVSANQTIQIKEKSGLVSGVWERSASQTTVPQALRLIGNYPNPFNGATQIRFALGVPGEVDLTINNLQGQTVKIITATFTGAGEKFIRWDATDWNAQPVSSGLYFYRLKINNEIASHNVGKMLYIK